MLKIDRFSDLTSDRVQAALATLKAEGQSGRGPATPTAPLSGALPAGHGRPAGCTPTPSLELPGSMPGKTVATIGAPSGLRNCARLIEVAEHGPGYRRMTGPALRVVLSAGRRLGTAPLRDQELEPVRVVAFGDTVTIPPRPLAPRRTARPKRCPFRPTWRPTWL